MSDTRGRWVALTWAGLVITLAGVVFGVWLQFDIPTTSGERTYFRLIVGIQSLVPVGVGLIVVGAGQILGAMQPRPKDSSSPTEIVELLD